MQTARKRVRPTAIPAASAAVGFSPQALMRSPQVVHRKNPSAANPSTSATGTRTDSRPPNEGNRVPEIRKRCGKKLRQVRQPFHRWRRPVDGEDLIEEHSRGAGREQVERNGTDDLVGSQLETGHTMEGGNEHAAGNSSQQARPGRLESESGPHRSESPREHHPFQGKIDDPAQL